MSNNQDKNSSGEERRNDKATEKATKDDRRKNSDKPEKRGEKDDTVLGEINDE